MRRCAASFVTAAYAKVRLMTQALLALPADLFTMPSIMAKFSTFYGFIIFTYPEKTVKGGLHLTRRRICGCWA
jgi:hypothetical protein